MRIRVRTLWPVGFALAGMAGGHLLGYMLAVPGSAHRGRVLAQTGHQQWNLVLAVCAVAGTSALAWVVARSFRAATHGMPVATLSLRPLVARLCALQVSLFAALEIVERAVSHDASPFQMISGRPFLVGVAVQMLVAFAAALVARGLGRVAAIAGGLFRARPRLRVAALRPVAFRAETAPLLVCAGAAGVRGPPRP